MKRSAVVFTAILLTTILVAISAGAQEVSKLDSTSISPALGSDIAKNPLRPADTSSWSIGNTWRVTC